MANVVKYKKTGDINLQGGILLDALTASNVPNAESGKKTLFLDVADTTLKTKDSSGTVASIGGGGGNSAPVAITSGTRNVVAADNGKLFTNAGATGDIILSLDTVANLGNAFEIGVVNEVVVIGDGIKLLVHLDEDDAEFINSSVNNLSITNNSVTYSASGKFSGCGVFSGSGHLLTSNSNAFSFGNGQWTAGAWFKTTTSGTAQQIVGQRPSSSSGMWSLRADELYYNDGGHNDLTHGQTYNDGQWHHIAAIRDGTHLYLYFDFVLRNTATIDVNFAFGFDNYPVSIGKEINDNAYFTGDIDEVFISRSITDASVETDFIIKGGITITPNSANQLPGTAAAGNSIKSITKGDYIKLRATGNGFICTGIYPAAANWFDQLD